MAGLPTDIWKEALEPAQSIGDTTDRLHSSDAKQFQSHIARIRHAAMSAEPSPEEIAALDSNDRERYFETKSSAPDFAHQVEGAYRRIARVASWCISGRLDAGQLHKELEKAMKPLALMLAAVDLKDRELPDKVDEAINDYLRDRRDLNKAKRLLIACTDAYMRGELTMAEPDFQIIIDAVKLDGLLYGAVDRQRAI